MSELPTSGTSQTDWERLDALQSDTHLWCRLLAQRKTDL
jgi:hypothetical protein